MAVCIKGLDKCVFSMRLPGTLKLQNERFLSTSFYRLADKPPKFVPPSKPVIVDKTQEVVAQRKYLSPEFIPPRQRTSPLKFALERKDMIRRRTAFNIPEFYVGSIMAVTMADSNANGKSIRFVGICIQRGGNGLGATFNLRNIINGQGVEICYEMYNPRLQKIEVLRLQKRLDNNLMYLRDALPEYSTVDPEMKAEPRSPTDEVPVNQLRVKMNPKPWSKRWERPVFKIQGIRFDLCLTPEEMEHAQKWAQPWRSYDMLRQYDTTELEKTIYAEVEKEMNK